MKMGSHIAAILTILLIGSFTEVLGTDIDRLRRMKNSINRYEVSNIEYDFARASQDLSPQFITFGQKMVTNDTPYDTTSTCSMEVSVSTTREWSITAGLEIYAGLTVTVTAGIPKFAEVTSEWSVGVSASFSYTHGKSYTSSVTKSNEITVDLPAYSDVSVSTIAKKATVNIPYTATVKTVYKNGKTSTKRNVKGVYKDVHHTSFETALMTSESSQSARTSGANGAFLMWPTISLVLLISCTGIFAFM